MTMLKNKNKEEIMKGLRDERREYKNGILKGENSVL